MQEWCPFALRRDGPSWKAGYASGYSAPKRGEVKHSAEGYLDGIYSVLDGPLRSSWHFTVGYDQVFQHYGLTVNTWHGNDVDDDGEVAANIDLVGVEHLGVAGQPLTDFQLDATVRLTQWCAEQFGFGTFSRYPDQSGWTLAEHNEVGNTYTACPSGRIPWEVILARLQGGDDMTEEEKIELAILRARAELENAVAAGKLIPVPGPIPGTVELHRAPGTPFEPPLVVPVQ